MTGGRSRYDRRANCGAKTYRFGPRALLHPASLLSMISQFDTSTSSSSAAGRDDWARHVANATGGACAPMLSGGSTATVGMESTVVFDACWRRFQQRYGSVSSAGRRRAPAPRCCGPDWASGMQACRDAPSSAAAPGCLFR